MLNTGCACPIGHVRTWLLFSALLLALISPAQAERVSLKMPNKLVANAEYRKGQAEKPAVLILHGFLQTHEFPTVHRLTDGLNSEGYTVLAPTLTLGVTHRRKSLACEAIHSHPLQDDFVEIDAWLKWLQRQGHDSIVLLGHSHGSTELTLYVQQRRPAHVRQLIAVSLIDVNSGPDALRNKAIEHEMRQKIAQHDRRPVTHPLSFCRQFVATPETLLSYVEWTPDRIMAELRKIPVPIALIMGSADDRIGPNWIHFLKKSGRKLHIIEGANHFLDGQYEFDLLDQVLAELRAS